MKALSIRQPWAWAILNAGKDIENRDWRVSNPGLRFRGPVLIHAAVGMTRAEYDDARYRIVSIAPTAEVPPLAALERGGIVGIANIVDMVRESDSPWFFGPYGLVISKPRRLPFTPLKGQLGFFDVPTSVLWQVNRGAAA